MHDLKTTEEESDEILSHKLLKRCPNYDVPIMVVTGVGPREVQSSLRHYVA
jgi:hypothetical protein